MENECSEENACSKRARLARRPANLPKIDMTAGSAADMDVMGNQDWETTLALLCKDATNVFVAEQAVSISLMQRRLKIKYSVLRVMERLENM